MTRDQLILKLQQEYALRREENVRIYERNVQAACERCKGLRELLDARHAALLSGVRSALLSQNKNPSANAALPTTMDGFNRKIADLLAINGLPADALAPVYTCAACKDEGYLYDPSRRMCACLERELNRRVLDDLGLQKHATFANFDEALYSDEVLEQYGVSQRQLMKRNFNACLAYAESFPNTLARDMLFMGASGLGKTFLMQAIAHRVTERGFGVLYVTAYKLIEQARSAYFANNSELMRPLMDAPLLLIDDLGTEPLMENITVTQLFNLINERQNADRHTLISTNLSFVALRERYTERITSRLMKGAQCAHLNFIGSDVRRRLPVEGSKA